MPDVNVPLNQTEAWEQALTSGAALIQEATSLQEQARQDMTRRLWRPAAEKFRRARVQYVDAVAQLEAPAMIGETSVRWLKSVRDEAQAALKQAQAALSALDSERLAERCDAQISEAADLIQQARAALNENQFASARSLALRASEQDPNISEQAEQIMREATEFEDGGSNVGRMIALVVLVGLIVGTVVMFGPAAWAWFNQFFFPASLAAYI